MRNVVRLVFDFDPVRPTGLPSTDAEMTAAAECRDAVVAGLRAAGDWPAPALGLSGNGAHAVWRVNVDLSQSDWPAATGILYAAIRNKFADMLAERGVLFDTAVRNPGRIWRLYGVMNRKGESTPERPHRLASIWLPSRWDRVPGKKIAVLVDRWAPAVIKERKAVSAPILVKGRVTIACWTSWLGLSLAGYIAAIWKAPRMRFCAPGVMSTHRKAARPIPSSSRTPRAGRVFIAITRIALVGTSRV